MKKFLDFIREQGVVGLAVGFVLGGSVSEVVNSLVEDIIDPLLGLALGQARGLTNFVINLSEAEIRMGHFISVIIDFLVIALVIFIFVKKLNLDKLDKSKE